MYRHVDPVADGDEVVAPVGVGDEVCHCFNTAVAAFLADGRVEATLAELGLAVARDAICAVGFECLYHELISAICTL